MDDGLLTVTFTLEKKKRKHKCPNSSTQNSSASSFCKKCGLDISRILPAFTSRQARAVKAFPLADSLTRNILEYLNYLRRLSPVSKFWLPSGRCAFRNYMVIPGFPPTRQAGSAQIELPITYANAT
ncbi:MAG: hypothetical protein ABSC91_05060 [Candidatus Bathyarchaeia archaeon]